MGSGQPKGCQRQAGSRHLGQQGSPCAAPKDALRWVCAEGSRGEGRAGLGMESVSPKAGTCRQLSSSQRRARHGSGCGLNHGGQDRLWLLCLGDPVASTASGELDQDQEAWAWHPLRHRAGQGRGPGWTSAQRSSLTFALVPCASLFSNLCVWL